MKYLIAVCLLLVGCNSQAGNILIVGDSISMGDGHPGNLGYTPYVQHKVSHVFHNGDCDLFDDATANGDNAGNSKRIVACLPKWLAKRHYTIVHFNAGLHDIHVPDCQNGGTAHEVELSDYLANLQNILDQIRAYGATPIFATTTPIEGQVGCGNEADIVAYNSAAVELMQNEGVQIDDLFSYMLPVQDQYHIPGNIHFTPDGYKYLSREVAHSLNQE